MSAPLWTIVWPAMKKSANGLARLFNAGLDGIARHFACRAAIATLRGLDDRALQDIGLVRSQIEAAVHGFIAAPDPTKDVMTASLAAVRPTIGPRAGGYRPASAVEAVSWS